jgi:hypothetical protein
VVKETIDGEDRFSIKETFYHEDGSIMGISTEPVIYAETFESLQQIIKGMKKACSKKILEPQNLNEVNQMRMPNQQ